MLDEEQLLALEERWPLDDPPQPEQAIRDALCGASPTIQALAPLGPSQRDLFVRYLRDPLDTTYALGFSVCLNSHVDPKRWTCALRAAERAAPTFRSRYFCFMETLWQATDTAVSVPVDIVELPREDSEAIGKAIQTCLARPFNLLDGAVRHLLLKGAKSTVAVLVCHHIAADAISAALFFHHVFAAYGGGGVREDPRFFEWVREAARAADTTAALAGLHARFANTRPLITADKDADLHEETARLDSPTVSALMSWCEDKGLRLVSVMKCLAARMLACHFQPQHDFVLYDVISGRALSNSTIIGCLYRVFPTCFSGPGLRFESLAQTARTLEHQSIDAQRSPATSMLAMSGMLRNTGAPVYVNFFDHTGIAPLLGRSMAAQRSFPGVCAARLTFHDQIDRQETHIVMERDASGMLITVRSRHPAFVDWPAASTLAAAALAALTAA